MWALSLIEDKLRVVSHSVIKAYYRPNLNILRETESSYTDHLM